MKYGTCTFLKSPKSSIPFRSPNKFNMHFSFHLSTLQDFWQPLTELLCEEYKLWNILLCNLYILRLFVIKHFQPTSSLHIYISSRCLCKSIKQFNKWTLWTDKRIYLQRQIVYPHNISAGSSLYTETTLAPWYKLEQYWRLNTLHNTDKST
jgi:hypothetical protein